MSNKKKNRSGNPAKKSESDIKLPETIGEPASAILVDEPQAPESHILTYKGKVEADPRTPFLGPGTDGKMWIALGATYDEEKDETKVYVEEMETED